MLTFVSPYHLAVSSQYQYIICLNDRSFNPCLHDCYEKRYCSPSSQAYHPIRSPNYHLPPAAKLIILILYLIILIFPPAAKPSGGSRLCYEPNRPKQPAQVQFLVGTTMIRIYSCLFILTLMIISSLILRGKFEE